MADSEPILIVDEDPAVRRRMAEALREAGHADVAEAGTGEMAQRILDSRGPFALVTLDLHLPDESGLMLLHALAPEAPATAVIVVTAQQGLTTAIECLRKGAYDYVLKPVHGPDIQFVVERALRRRRHELEIAESRLETQQRAERRVDMLEETRRALLIAVCRMAEFRRPQPHVHPERVAAYSVLLAEALARGSPYAAQIDRKFIEDLGEAALLHDIGKLAMPERVLMKPGELTAEEAELARSHARVGREICRSVEAEVAGPGRRFIRIVIEVTGSHHERWDGKGYPEGLRGQQIPLSARIVAVADFYDVLRTPLVYRPEVLEPAELARRVNAEAAKAFDPVVVEGFNRRREEFRATEARLAQSQRPGSS